MCMRRGELLVFGGCRGCSEQLLQVGIVGKKGIVQREDQNLHLLRDHHHQDLFQINNGVYGASAAGCSYGEWSESIPSGLSSTN